jgi:hypothetical protein
MRKQNRIYTWFLLSVMASQLEQALQTAGLTNLAGKFRAEKVGHFI